MAKKKTLQRSRPPATRPRGRPRLSDAEIEERRQRRNAMRLPPTHKRKITKEGERIFNSMKQMEGAMGIARPILQRAKNAGCPAFVGNHIHEREYLVWVDANPEKMQEGVSHVKPPWEDDEEAAAQGGDGVKGTITTEDKGVGKAYDRAQIMEQHYAKKLDFMMKKGAPAEALAKASDLHLKYMKAMLEFETKLEQSKRDAGMLMPMDEIMEGTKALLVWLNVAFCTVARPLIPELEGKNATQMRVIITDQLRAAVLRSLSNGIKTGRLPKYIADCAASMAKQSFNLGGPNE